jgi:hypothetical protein
MTAGSNLVRKQAGGVRFGFTTRLPLRETSTRGRLLFRRPLRRALGRAKHVHPRDPQIDPLPRDKGALFIAALYELLSKSAVSRQAFGVPPVAHGDVVRLERLKDRVYARMDGAAPVRINEAAERFFAEESREGGPIRATSGTSLRLSASSS